MSKQSVSSTYFLSAFNSCIDAGCDPAALAKTLEIDELSLRNPAGRFSDQTYLQLLHLAEAMLGESGIGVKIGQEFRPQTFRDIGYVAISCENIKEALALNQKYQPLTQEIGTTHLEFEDKNAKSSGPLFSTILNICAPLQMPSLVGILRWAFGWHGPMPAA